MGVKLDDLDFKIIHQLQGDGRISITDLADKVGSSRPTVTNRLKKLVDKGFVVVNGGLNIRRLGFKVACVGLEVKNGTDRLDVENCLESCPRVLNVFRTCGKANVHLSMWGEDDQTVNSMIESFRDYPNVDIVYSHYLGTPIHGDVKLRVEFEEHREPPCGRICSKCNRYVNGWCMGCPCSADYRNPLLERLEP
ncbi:MAG: Lrp/AsnC family transcriptional regulator [Candidatus Bathyarchaeota archaeon]|nr:Lrp/AsnC family transcriptional regulator [Candidatus Bathyarchaeota archaeon]